MRNNQKRSINTSTAKVLLAGVLSFGAIGAFAQVPPPPQAPPPPGELLEKLNPFKKKTKTTYKKDRITKDRSTRNKDEALLPDEPKAPPAPPNPIKLIKKIKIPPPPPLGGE